jgi:hypothetical protein
MSGLSLILQTSDQCDDASSLSFAAKPPSFHSLETLVYTKMEKRLRHSWKAVMHHRTPELSGLCCRAEL